MKKCLILQELHTQAFRKEGNCFESLILQQSSSLNGRLLMSMTEGDVNELAKLSAPLLSEELDFSTKGHEKCLPPITQVVLDNEQCSLLKISYELLYPRLEINTLQRFVKKSARVSFGGVWLKKASRDSNITVSAYWPTFSEATNSDRNFSCLSIGEIQYFISHKVTFSGNQVKNEHNYLHMYTGIKDMSATTGSDHRLLCAIHGQKKRVWPLFHYREYHYFAYMELLM